MKKTFFIIFCCILFPIFIHAQNHQLPDTTAINLEEIVVTGSRVPISRDIMPVPISVVNRSTIERSEETNLLPVLMQQVPSLFVTSRGIAGYGVSTGSAGGINLRGFGAGSGRVLVLIDGHPQYATIYVPLHRWEVVLICSIQLCITIIKND